MLKKSDAHLMYRDFQSQSASAITMRTDMPPFNEVRVRRAVSHAIDRQALIERRRAGAYRARSSPPAWRSGRCPSTSSGRGEGTMSMIRRRPGAAGGSRLFQGL